MDKKKNPSSIFRPAALKKLTSPEQLDKLLTVVKPKTWIALAITIFLILLGLLWAIFGKISTIAMGEGIYLDFSEIYPILIPANGRILQIPITLGQKVEKGETIAIIWDIEKKKEIDISAPYTSIVLDIEREKGASVVYQEVFASLQKNKDTKGKNDRFYCFIPARIGDKIRKNMKALIFPWSINSRSYGGIKGYVEKISYIPASEYYFRTLHINETYAQHLIQEKAFIPLIIRPKPSKKGKKFFEWTAKIGPVKEDVPLGSFASVQIAIEKRSPISYLLPFWFFRKVEEKIREKIKHENPQKTHEK